MYSWNILLIAHKFVKNVLRDSITANYTNLRGASFKLAGSEYKTKLIC